MSKILKDISEIEKIRNSKNKIILCGGCFDVLHAAHIDFLQNAKSLGGKLILLLESDLKVKKMKGDNRPVNKQGDRAKILASLSMVDGIIRLPFIESSQEYMNLVKKIKPDIIAVTEDDPLKKGKESQARVVGAKVVEVIKRRENYSTTKIIEKINKI